MHLTAINKLIWWWWWWRRWWRRRRRRWWWWWWLMIMVFRFCRVIFIEKDYLKTPTFSHFSLHILQIISSLVVVAFAFMQADHIRGIHEISLSPSYPFWRNYTYKFDRESIISDADCRTICTRSTFQSSPTTSWTLLCITACRRKLRGTRSTVSEVVGRRQLRSASRRHLTVLPRYRLSTFGPFRVDGSYSWDCLPDRLRVRDLTLSSDSFRL